MDEMGLWRHMLASIVLYLCTVNSSLRPTTTGYHELLDRWMSLPAHSQLTPIPSAMGLSSQGTIIATGQTEVRSLSFLYVNCSFKSRTIGIEAAQQ